MAALPFPSPTTPAGSRAEVLLGYVDFFRSVLLDKVDGLGADELRHSRLPSGWTPLELVKHLTFVERRWLVWGFEGRDVGDPWGDEKDGRWDGEPSEEYARHVGHLDVVRELADGRVGEE